jgi:hypothetical protein
MFLLTTVPRGYSSALLKSKEISLRGAQKGWFLAGETSLRGLGNRAQDRLDGDVLSLDWKQVAEQDRELRRVNGDVGMVRCQG